MSDENEMNATHSDEEVSESEDTYQTASDGEHQEDDDEIEDEIEDDDDNDDGDEEDDEEEEKEKPTSKRKRVDTETSKPRAKKSKNLNGTKIPKNLRYGKALVWAAVTRALIRPMVQLESKVSAPFPVALVHGLWDLTTKFMLEHYPGAKFKSPSLAHKLSMVFPGKDVVIRSGIKDEVAAAIEAACEESGISGPRGLSRVNMTLRSESEMRCVLPDTPGHAAMYLLFQGNNQLYQQLVTLWWNFISAFEKHVKA